MLVAAAAAAAAKPLDYLCYSPYRDGQAPGGAAPSEDQIRADLALIAPLARGIRTYGASGILGRIPDLARAAGLEVYPGAWIGPDDAANQAELDALIALARSGNPAIRGLIVGNETLLRGDVSVGKLKSYLGRVRDAGTGLPVGTADVYQNLIQAAPDLDSTIDFALCHVHPYWENVAAPAAAGRVAAGWAQVRAAYPGKPVLVGETGFPTAGDARGDAVPGEGAQADFLAALAAAAARDGIPVMWFEAFDEPWKSAEGAAGAHWGLWKADRTEKPALARLRASTGLAGLARPPRKDPGRGFAGLLRQGSGTGTFFLDALGRARAVSPTCAGGRE
jgi:exo-beta-1,3-glucanase (GH17 family)